MDNPGPTPPPTGPGPAEGHPGTPDNPAGGAPATPPPAPGSVSVDGTMWWDGQAWLPVPGAVARGSGSPAGAASFLAAEGEPRPEILHVAASVIVPGLGTILSGHRDRGLRILGGTYGVLAVFMILRGITTPTTRRCLAGSAVCITSVGESPLNVLFPVVMLVVVGVWIFGMYDAYRTTAEWNRTHGVG